MDFDCIIINIQTIIGSDVCDDDQKEEEGLPCPPTTESLVII